MRAMTVDELRSVIAHENAPCVSIYMPTSRGGSQDDRAQFAGHVREARKLLGKELSHAQVDDLMAPVTALDEPQFWTQRLEGLALFRSRDYLTHYSLPLKLEHLTVVADSFHVRPVLRFLQSNQRYFLLNLSLGRASFFKGSAMGLGPVDVPNMPRSIGDTTAGEQHERVLQSHAGSSHSVGPKSGEAPIYHGQGKLENVRAEDVRAYYRAIDKALWEMLRDETAPLVVAATEEHHPMYASASRYPHLLHDGVQGNFNNTPLPELHAKAWPIVQRHLMQREDEVLEHYGDSIKRHRSTDEVHSVSAAAVQGRVRELLVLRDAHLWGRMDPATGEVALHPGDRSGKQQDAHDDDVIDDIAEAVILRGGSVYSFEKNRMPTKSPLAAVLRW
jgi:hypothetical protein